MPNTPVIVKNGTIYASGTAVGEEDKALLDNMLNSVGVGMKMQAGTLYGHYHWTDCMMS